MSDLPVPIDDTDEPQEKRKIISEADFIRDAREAIADGDKAEAKALVKQVLNQNGSNPDALWLYGTLFADENKAGALKALNRLITLQPDHPRATALINRLESELTSTPQAQSAYMPQYAQQPQVVIHNNNINTVGAGRAGRNDTAFIIGLIIGIIPGFFGLAHLLNGKVGSGIVLILASLVWGAIALGITAATAGLGACIVLPLHIYIAYSTAKSGAAYS